MLIVLIASFAVSFVLTLVTIRSFRKYARWLGDHDFSGPQKFHARVVPRIGGVGIFVGLIVGLGVLYVRPASEQVVIHGLLLSTLPVFFAGLAEDITKRVTPRMRLAAAVVSAGVAAWLLDAVIDHTSVPGLEFIAQTSFGAVALALFVVAGLSNAINIIDGMNGLASMCVMIMLAGLAYVANQVGDPLIAGAALVVLGAVLGFFVWNYPNGLVFLGDGGAYLLGFLLAELSILLLHRNAEVSPLFPLLLVAYPVFETLFTMYRRKFVRGRSMGLPDGIHLHSLIYRRLIRWAVGSTDASALTRRNARTAPYLWVLCSLSVVPATLWWNDTAMLAGCLALFIASYVALYASIVRFRTPRWLVVDERRSTARSGHRP